MSAKSGERGPSNTQQHGFGFLVWLFLRTPFGGPIEGLVPLKSWSSSAPTPFPFQDLLKNGCLLILGGFVHPYWKTGTFKLLGVVTTTLKSAWERVCKF